MNFKKQKLRNHEDVLEAIADAINISEDLYKAAKKKYQDIGSCLDNSPKIKRYRPEVYPQGSFLLGTVIRPVGDTDEYDIDLVCELKATTQDFSMEELKSDIGEAIIEHFKSNGVNKKLEDKRRCWTIEYDGNFHVDILPSLSNVGAYRNLMEQAGAFDIIANQEILEKAIAITDKTHPLYEVRYNDWPAQYKVDGNDWPVSNPRGYGVWFKSRQNIAVNSCKKVIMESYRGIYASLDEVPDYKVKTPLQRSIQLLKRHRDIMFKDDDDKPISIIITTLSALAYKNEPTISEALRSILKYMDEGIVEKNGAKWVANPVNPEENFADKWEEVSRKEQVFVSWLKQARKDFGSYLSVSSYDKVPMELQESLSKVTVEKILPMIVSPVAVSSADAGAAEAEKIISERRATKPWSQ